MKKRFTKRISSLVLALTLSLTMMIAATPLSVLAVGDDFTWSQGLNSSEYIAANATGDVVYVPFYDNQDSTFYLLALGENGDELWRSEGVETPIDTSPLVGTDGTIYFGANYDSNSVAHMYALNPDGTTKWHTEIGETAYEGIEFYGQMSLSNSGVLVATGIYDNSRCLFAFDSKTGEFLWELGSEGEYNFRLRYIWSGHVIFGDLLYAMNYYNYTIVGVDLLTGEALWETDIDDCCGAYDSSMSVDEDGTLYCVGDDSSEIFAINPDGTVKWSQANHVLSDDNSYQTACDDDFVYVAACGYVLTLDKETGDVLVTIDLYDIINAEQELLDGHVNNYWTWSWSMILLDDGSMVIGYNNLILCLSATGDLLDYSIIEDYWFYDYGGGDYDYAFEYSRAILAKDGSLYVSYRNNDYLTSLLCFNLDAGPRAGWAMSGYGAGATNSRLTAEEEKFTVTFATNGGTAVEAVEVTAGDTITKPTTTKEGYTLTGWYTEEGLVNIFDFDTPITGNLTLYAGWKANTPTSPETGDAGIVGLVAMFALTGGLSFTAFKRKK